MTVGLLTKISETEKKKVEDHVCHIIRVTNVVSAGYFASHMCE